MKQHTQESNIYVLKYKIYIPEKHMYGCIIITSDIERKKIFKVTAVVSINPEVYEIDIKSSWENVEREVLRYRLQNATLFDTTKRLYSDIYKNEEKICLSLKENDIDVIKDIILKSINVSDTDKKMKYMFDIEKFVIRDLNKSNFVTPHRELQNQTYKLLEEEKFYIKTKPVIDNNSGVPANKLKPKKELLCEIIDRREVVKYITELLFGKGQKYISGKIVDISTSGKYYEIILSITPVIYTKIVVDKQEKLKLVNRG